MFRIGKRTKNLYRLIYYYGSLIINRLRLTRQQNSLASNYY